MNETIKFIIRHQKTIGIIILILFAISVFAKNQKIETSFFSGSLLGNIGGIGLNLGVILVLIGIIIVFIGPFTGPSGAMLIPGGAILITSGLLLAKGSIIALIIAGIEFIIKYLSNPIIAIMIGLFLLFLIFRKKNK